MGSPQQPRTYRYSDKVILVAGSSAAAWGYDETNQNKIVTRGMYDIVVVGLDRDAFSSGLSIVTLYLTVYFNGKIYLIIQFMTIYGS